MSEKVVGYSLLTIGIIIILFSVFNVYQVFTKQIKPVEFFNIPAPQIDITQLISGSLPKDLTNIFESGETKKQEVISAAAVNDPLNLTAHLFLMGFVAGAGYKLGSLGVMLVRPIVVKVKEAQPKN